MMNKYYDYGRDFERELCCEMEKWYAGERTPGVLRNIKELLETITLCQEKEAGNAMREYLEEEQGYNSRSGEFRERMMENPYYSVYNFADRGSSQGGNQGGNQGGGRGGNQGGSRGGSQGGSGSRGGYNRGGNGNGGSRGGNQGGNQGGGQGSRGGSSGGSSGGSYNMVGPEDYPDGRYPFERYPDERYPDYNYPTYPYRVYNHVDKEKMEQGKKGNKEKLSEKEMKEWAEKMENSDGSSGPIFTQDEANSLAKKVGVEYKDYSPVAFWLTMNMMYSDYGETMEKYGMNKPEGYAALAKDWLEDEDSIKGEKKLAAYYNAVCEDE